MPVAIRPVAVAAPPEVEFDTATGPSSWEVKTGFAGTLGANVRGLVPGGETAWTVAQDPDQSWAGCGDTQSTFTKAYTVPAGATVMRVGIYEDAITPTGTDLDLYLCFGSALVGVSGDGDSNEEITLDLEPGDAGLTLTAYVHGFATAGASASGTLFDWFVGSGPATPSNTTLAITPPGSATVGGTKTVTATFTGLAADRRYMGTVHYTANGSDTGIRTILRVNT